MGGDITTAVKEIRKKGIPVISLNIAGSVPKAADLVVSDPLQAGVMAVMAIANTAKFDLDKVRGERSDMIKTGGLERRTGNRERGIEF